MKTNALIFDLDGTLLDTVTDLSIARNYALRKFGYPERSVEQTRLDIGRGVGNLIAAALPQKYKDINYRQVLECFKDYYRHHFDVKTKPYQNVLKTLQILKSRGYLLAVVTNKFQEGAQSLINQFFPNIFTIVVGENDKMQKKPNPEMINFVLETLSLNKDYTMYIGDTEIDLYTAENAGIKSVILSTGYRTINELSKLNITNNVIPSFETLLEMFK